MVNIKDDLGLNTLWRKLEILPLYIKLQFDKYHKIVIFLIKFFELCWIFFNFLKSYCSAKFQRYKFKV